MLDREIKDKFKSIANSRKVVLITGARQVGKSTFVKSLMEDDRTYITLDDLNLRELAQNDPKLFLMNYSGKLVIDEVQYAPDLFSYIKMEVDNSDVKGKYWLTGSQRFELMNNVSESLAGRVSILEMSTLSFREKNKMKQRVFDPSKLTKSIDLNPNKVFESIYQGGMPEYVCNELDRNQFFNDYLLTYLERDVRNLTQVGDLTRFRKFMIAVASRTGEELNYNSLCEDADIDATTAKRWISILEASDIIYLLKPYFNSELKRTTKTPKIIFMDTGLCAYLCAWNSSDNLMNSSVSGHYLETFVISELIKNKRNSKNSLEYDIYYYRDRDNKEIDLIIKKDNLIYPFKIKKTAKPDINMISNFKVLDNKKINIGGGGLICFYDNIIPLNDKYKSFPISVIF